MKTIQIFLASSAELKSDREKFEILIARENDNLQKRNVYLRLTIWENFTDAVSATRLQDEYNKAIEASDIFVMLFFTKVGMYTSEEFDKALAKFKQSNKPYIYTYFKNADIKFSDLRRDEANSVWDFLEKLKTLGHFHTSYETESSLHLHFKQQLEKLFDTGKIELPLTGNDSDNPPEAQKKKTRRMT